MNSKLCVPRFIPFFLRSCLAWHSNKERAFGTYTCTCICTCARYTPRTLHATLRRILSFIRFIKFLKKKNFHLLVGLDGHDTGPGGEPKTRRGRPGFRKACRGQESSRQETRHTAKCVFFFFCFVIIGVKKKKAD